MVQLEALGLLELLALKVPQVLQARKAQLV
jgi:hypothetical protein